MKKFNYGSIKNIEFTGLAYKNHREDGVVTDIHLEGIPMSHIVPASCHFTVFTPNVKNGNIARTNINTDFKGVDANKFALYFASAWYYYVKLDIDNIKKALDEAENATVDDAETIACINARIEVFNKWYDTIKKELPKFADVPITTINYVIARMGGNKFDEKTKSTTRELVTILSENYGFSEKCSDEELAKSFSEIKTKVYELCKCVWHQDENGGIEKRSISVNDAFARRIIKSFYVGEGHDANGNIVAQFKSGKDVTAQVIFNIFRDIQVKYNVG